jgi:hypothetical protein
LFVSDWEEETAVGGKVSIIRKAQWRVVRKASAMVRGGKLRRRNLSSLETVVEEDGKAHDHRVENATGESSS